jgi:hypothetical protein
MRLLIIFFSIIFLPSIYSNAQELSWIDGYNPVWKKMSKDASESMPCGGGDVGMNVWVENGEVLIYLSRPGTIDENNAFLKLGRIRLSFEPDIFADAEFSQELILRDGYVKISAKGNKNDMDIDVWSNVYSPAVGIDVHAAKPVSVTAAYETWRTSPLVWDNPGMVRASIAYRGAPVKAVVQPDSVSVVGDGIVWYHKNRKETIFDITVKQQHLEHVKDKMWNPVENLTFGGCMSAEGFEFHDTLRGKYIDTDYKAYRLKSKKAGKTHSVNIAFNTGQVENVEEWKDELYIVEKDFIRNRRKYIKDSRKWWNEFWKKSYIVINPDSATVASSSWQIGRNYQLFRYQLGCNAYGKMPTKFNGGMFTYDPSLVHFKSPFTPDHRDWGGGTHTAQNQRLVYWPMLRNGDFEMLLPQLDFYLNSLVNAELRVKEYWGHEGACFTEQIEWFGLPMAGSYGWNRPEQLHDGIQYNLWVEYEWDTVLEFCKMAIDLYLYCGYDISRYMPLIEKSLIFFDKHYQYLAAQRGARTLDGKGKLVLYPSTGCETYKMAYNSANTIAALKCVTRLVTELPDKFVDDKKREYYKKLLNRIPDLPFAEMNGHKVISPAVIWERINNIEIPQLYPVFPWGLYGIGLPDLEVAVNTWKYGLHNPSKQKNHVSWHQDAIFCARMGLTDEAKRITLKKMCDSPRRFPTFWGPGHDWVPDHNWGGSGMIGVQEMLVQTVGDKIYLLPAWPSDWDVTFKQHLPGGTVIECIYKLGKIEKLELFPKERMDDVVYMK